MNDKEFMGFDQHLEDTDFGLIISKDGMIKGIWSPKTEFNQEFPKSLSDLCVQYFGIDPNENHPSFTVH